MELADYDIKYPHKLPYTTPLYRYTPEQYFCFTCVKRSFPDIQFDDWTDWNEKNIEQSQQILYNNFIFLGLNQSGIYSKKHSGAMKNEEGICGLITFQKFQKRYKEYCLKDGSDNLLTLGSETNVDNQTKLKEHVRKFRLKFKAQTAIFSELFSIMYYFTKTLFERRDK